MPRSRSALTASGKRLFGPLAGCHSTYRISYRIEESTAPGATTDSGGEIAAARIARPAEAARQGIAATSEGMRRSDAPISDFLRARCLAVG
jgi:hypothetical protein